MKVTDNCSGCQERFTLDRDALTVTMRKPSNGVRGQRHVPAHNIVVEAVEVGHMIEWECPLCDYAESEEV